jgi:hypothetical protein
MDTISLRAEEVLRPEALPEYRDAMNLFQGQLALLNASLLVAEKFIEFPLDLFGEPGREGFFQLVIHSFLQSAVLILTRLTTDQGPECYTLVKFRNHVYQWVQPEYFDAMRARLGHVDFDRRTKRVRERMKRIRDSRIAHLIVTRDEDAHLRLSPVAGTNVAELKGLCDEVESLFSVLSMGTEYHTWFLQYSPNLIHPQGADARSDVERVLDLVARDSAVFNLPETAPESWPVARATLGPQAIERLNAYRRKLGCSEV